MIEKARFTYTLLGKASGKQGITIAGTTEKQRKSIEDEAET